MKNLRVKNNSQSVLLFALVLLLSKVAFEFHKVAWGTGNWLGQFSFKWGVIFFLFVSFLIGILFSVKMFFWDKQKLQKVVNILISQREKIGIARYLVIIFLISSSVFYLQYTLWGLVFTDTYLRVFYWGLLILSVAFLLSKQNTIISLETMLVSAFLVSTGFVITSVFANVSAYPFNLYWSDGNRIWDYSILFGRRLYNYPANQTIDAYISPGRQFIWGLPFLLPNTSILFNRFWSALVFSLPYMIFGWLIFRRAGAHRKEWFALGVWTFLFLNQGPIYTPLVLSAILVVLAWGSPLWLGIPLVIISGFYAQTSRLTWLVAPAIWIGMLELADIPPDKGWLPLKKWSRVTLLTLSGLIGGVLTPVIIQFLESKIIATPASSISNSLSQPLLWNRLLPNETYSVGILLGLLLAIGPLLFILNKQKLSLNFIQSLGLWLAMLAFLFVGLVASTKIGGGTNLHNLDMFLVGMVFLVALVWKRVKNKIYSDSFSLISLKLALFVALILPAYPALINLRPNHLSFSSAEIAKIKVLVDYDSSVDAPIPSLPSDEEVDAALEYISSSVDNASIQGEVLFIDVRQLLTFGYISKIPLVPEYEKKRMMDEAMSSNIAYFTPYYQDLADKRFSLIISEPLKIPLKEEGAFSQEGDAWNKWVAAPTLCFYEPVKTFKSVYVQVLIPRAEVSEDCSKYLN